jgi:hypothetical protein
MCKKIAKKEKIRESPGFPSEIMVDRRGIEPRTYGLRVDEEENGKNEQLSLFEEFRKHIK